MRLVPDTNVVVSGLFWKGPPSQLLRLALLGRATLWTTPALLDELTRVLRYPKLRKHLLKSGLTEDTALESFKAVAQIAHPAFRVGLSPRDPSDDAVLACAIASGADAIVSGDDHLLALEAFQGIPILTATAALARIQLSTSPLSPPPS